MTLMTIGEVAHAAGVGIETIRYYERTGLLESPPRTPSGYRQFPPDAVNRLGFIKHAQRPGFNLAEVAGLLKLHQEAVPCEGVKQRAATKVAMFEEKVAELLAVRDELLALMERCEIQCEAGCTVLTAANTRGSGERTKI